jgi:uncharacterized protein (TIGR03118 family)
MNWSRVWNAGKITLFALLFTSFVHAQHYTRTDLTADAAATSMSAPNHDPNLVNAWGLARGSGTPFWVADNGTGVATLYNGAGVPQPAQPLIVTIPSPNGETSAPTGALFNYTTGFEVATGKPSRFIFCTEDGTIVGWNSGNAGVIIKNRAGRAIYKGCTLTQTGSGKVYLVATNFKTGNLEVFDSKMNLVLIKDVDFRAHSFDSVFRFMRDRDRAEFVPFGIQNVGGFLVVTFAKREAGEDDEEHGAGLGFVAIFDANLHFVRLLEHGNFLNAPWGIALAPSDFGPFSHRLLIGNFGDGTIVAYNIATGKFQGKLLAPDGKALMVDGLWALSFGGGTANNGLSNELFFTAGPNDEHNGLFGKITATASEQRGNAE